jgi:CRISPR-associated protein Cas5d
MLDKEVVRLKVTGDLACFTRPDLKVERMSYPCMTPSAARGILEAILWRPEFQWFIRRIIILNRINFCSIKRNEIQWKNTLKGKPIDISDIRNRVQRNSIVLKDVAYIIEASVFVKEELLTQKIPGKPPITVKKYREMFERRVRNGQCWHQPFLGTREFAADFSVPDDNDVPLDITYPIGSMFYDMFYDEKGKAIPEFFYDVAIVNGILECPGDKAMKMLASTHIQPKASDDYNRVVYEHYKEEEADL